MRLAEAYRRLGGEAAKASLEVKDAGDQASETGDQLSEFAKEAARSMQRAFSDFFFDAFDNGLKGLEKAFLRTIQRMIADALAADLLHALFGANAPGASADGNQTGQLVSAFGNALGSIFHDGGVVGGPAPTRAVPAAAFAGAQRFHTGGLPGLRHNEIPVIAQKGEEILPRSSPRHIANAGGQAPQLNVRNINVIRPEDVADAMNTPAGEQTVLNIIGRNPDSVKGALG